MIKNIASSSSFFRFRSDSLAFFARISYFIFLEFKEFNKTIIQFALVGYETGYSQLGATLFTISYPTRAHGIIVNYTWLTFLSFDITFCVLFKPWNVTGTCTTNTEDPLAVWKYQFGDRLALFHILCQIVGLTSLGSWWFLLLARLSSASIWHNLTPNTIWLQDRKSVV